MAILASLHIFNIVNKWLVIYQVTFVDSTALKKKIEIRKNNPQVHSSISLDYGIDMAELANSGVTHQMWG